MKNKRILITGAAGSIGSELVRQLTPNNKIYAIDNNESGLFEVLEDNNGRGWCYGRVGDVRDRKVVEDVFSDFKPQIIFHAAALKHVPLMELTPREAISTNILGTLNVIEAAKKWECFEKFVFISTDKAVQSTSVMGATKRIGEIITRNQGRGWVVVRFGNVLGSRGSVIPIWQKAIDKGEKLKVTHPEATRYMMTLEEAVHLVISASEFGTGGEIICLDMGKKVSVLEIAHEILHRAGRDSAVEVIGLRPGEQLTEELMTSEEKAIAIKKNKFFIIK